MIFNCQPNGLAPFSPVATVKVTVAYGLGKVLRLYVLGCLQVGYGACYLKYAVVCAGGQVEAFHGSAQQVYSSLVGLGVLVYHALGHLCVAVYSVAVLEALFLDEPGLDYPWRMLALLSPCVERDMSLKGTGVISICMSILSSNGPLILLR